MEVVRKVYDRIGEEAIERPLSMDDLTKEELIELLDKSLEDCRKGKCVTLEEYAKIFNIEE